MTLHAAFLHALFLPSGQEHPFPAKLALEEVYQIFGRHREIGCFISCGLGVNSSQRIRTASGDKLDDKRPIPRTTRNIVNDVNLNIAKKLENVYFRFDLKEYLESLSDEEFVKVWYPVLRKNDWRILQLIGILSDQYLQSPGGADLLRRCCERLRPIRKRTRLGASQDSHSNANDVDLAFESVTVSGVSHITD